MGFRFHRRVTIIPGVHLNLGARGASVTVGPRGASINVGRHGTHATLSVPGTGLSYRTKLAGGHASPDQERVRDREESFGDLDRQIAKWREPLAMVHLDTPRLSGAAGFDLPKPDTRDVAALMAWRAAKANFESGHLLDEESAAGLVEIALGRLAWPRRTEVAYRIDDEGRSIAIDIDLPELEDMPDTEPAVDRRAGCIVDRALTARQRADLYATHVAGIAFRLIGALFATLPSAERVSLSAYTTRSTGGAGTHNDYVAVATVTIDRWRRIDLSDLGAVDVEDAVRRLGIRMERTGQGLLVTLNPCF